MPQTIDWTQVPKRSPFLELLTDYMWDTRQHGAPLNVGQLSYKTGISKNTIWGWIREGRIPRPAVLEVLSSRTGIPLDQLYAACGYALPGQEYIERDPFADMIARVQRDSRFSAASKQAIIDSLMRIELGEAEAERQRMIYSEAHTTVDSLPVVTRSSDLAEQPTEPEQPAVAPVSASTPRRATTTAPRSTRTPARRETKTPSSARTPKPRQRPERSMSGR